jgi:hypothetical protein
MFLLPASRTHHSIGPHSDFPNKAVPSIRRQLLMGGIGSLCGRLRAFENGDKISHVNYDVSKNENLLTSCSH